MTRDIQLTKGYITIVDNRDYEYLIQHSWHAKETRWKPHGYVVHACTTIDKQTIRMSRVIMQAPPNVEVDHKNRDTLDNRRENLRLVTSIQNQANQGIRKQDNKCSQFKGVSVTLYGKWTARITHQQKTIHLGNFLTEIDAALAYDQAAMRLFGEFARTNRMEGLYDCFVRARLEQQEEQQKLSEMVWKQED